MVQYLYPAVFRYEEDAVVAYFPDLNISIDGKSIEEAYLFAQDYLRVYITYAKKHELDFNSPSKFEKIKESFDGHIVMLIETVM